MIKNKHTPEQSHSTIKRVLRQTFSNRLSYYNEEQIDAGCSDRASEICKAAESLGIVLGDVSELTKQRDELLKALEEGRRLIELISPFEGDVTRQIDKAIASVKEKQNAAD